ncbi:MAG: hypothetical protein E6R05_06655 [Candidatus Moraniibacteriota bacterium]|nr:MAG: hypothetical protein E6R05_06655 [Candidatus Moranbacteria bacterium]
MRLYSPEEIKQGKHKALDPSLWTVVIPAAGKGTRLGYHKAKILYPILGRPILDHLIDLLEPFVGQFFFVLSPFAASDVVPILERRLPGKFQAPVIKDSRGMASLFIKQCLTSPLPIPSLFGATR